MTHASPSCFAFGERCLCYTLVSLKDLYCSSIQIALLSVFSSQRSIQGVPMKTLNRAVVLVVGPLLEDLWLKGKQNKTKNRCRVSISSGKPIKSRRSWENVADMEPVFGLLCAQNATEYHGTLFWADEFLPNTCLKKTTENQMEGLWHKHKQMWEKTCFTKKCK